MDWDQDGQFWIGLPAGHVEEIVSLIRQMMSDKFGGDWSQRPSQRAAGRFVENQYNHYLFAKYTHKGIKERYAEVHTSETGRTIFVRFWQGLHEDGQVTLERHGFKFHSEIPQEYRVKVPGLEITPEKTATLEKFRTSKPLSIPKGKLETIRTGSSSWIGFVFVVIMLAIAAFLLRDQLHQVFVKEKPLNLGTFLVAKSKIAVYERSGGQLIYALSVSDIESKVKPETIIYGSLIDSSRTDFYSIQKIADPQGTILYQATKEVTVSIPSFIEGNDLNQYQVVDASRFRYDKNKDWEDLQDKKVVLKGTLFLEEDGFFLGAGDGFIKLLSPDPITLLHLQVALKKSLPVSLYGMVGTTFEWEGERKETKKMFRFSIDRTSYAAMTAS